MCNWRLPRNAPFFLSRAFHGPLCKHPADPEDPLGFCVFHASLERKRKNEALCKKFCENWWKVYDTGDWYFAGFKFPDKFDFGRMEKGNHIASNFSRKPDEYTPDIEKRQRQPINFFLAEFGTDTVFESTYFGDEAYFMAASFGNGTNFREARFGNKTDFREAKFADSIDFSKAVFGDQCDFNHADFGEYAKFNTTTFGDSISFKFTKFGGKVDFGSAVFGDYISFMAARFGNSANFMSATFGDRATWSDAIFDGKMNFSNINGKSLVYQVEVGPIGKEARSTHQATIHGPNPAEHIFESTQFRGPANFSSNDLSRTRFQLVDLSNISFLHSQINETKFISCKWGNGVEAGSYHHRKPTPIFRFKRTRILFDELIFRRGPLIYHRTGSRNLSVRIDESLWRLIGRKPDNKFSKIKRRFKNALITTWRHLFRRKIRKYKDNEPVDEVNKDSEDDTVFGKEFEDLSPGLIEVLALQLKQSLEATKDPIAAGDFHFCAMEMKRLRAAEEGRGARAKGLWWYKMVNGYGERYGRTLMWLGWLVAIFSVLFAWAGAEVFNGGSFWGRLEPAAFFALQHVLPFKFSQQIWEVGPTHTAMRWLSFIETFFGTSLFAFFLLALRRRFKR